MSKLRETIEFIALNDSPGDPTPEDREEAIDELTGWLSVATAAVALDRDPKDIASRVLTYRATGKHSRSNRQQR